jgi:hypothetical protein
MTSLLWVILALLDRIRIRIRIPNADPNPDPADQNECGSVRIRIRNTVYKLTGTDWPIRVIAVSPPARDRSVRGSIRGCSGRPERATGGLAPGAPQGGGGGPPCRLPQGRSSQGDPPSARSLPTRRY